MLGKKKGAPCSQRACVSTNELFVTLDYHETTVSKISYTFCLTFLSVLLKRARVLRKLRDPVDSHYGQFSYLDQES